MPTLIAIGEILYDFLRINEDDPEALHFTANPGGAPANLACTTQAYNISSGLIGMLGKDILGNQLLMYLANKGVDVRGIDQTSDAFTTSAYVSLENGERSFSFARKPGADQLLHLNDKQKEILAKAEILHYGSNSLTDEPSRSATFEAIEIVKSNAGLLSCDINIRTNLWSQPQDLMELAMKAMLSSHILKASQEDLEHLNIDNPQDLIMANDSSIKLLLVTLGAEGAKLYVRREESIHEILAPMLQINREKSPIDTTAAGDIFYGSFITALVEELDEISPNGLDSWILRVADKRIYDILQLSNSLATLSTLHYGGISSIPSYEKFVELKQEYLT